MSPTFLYKNLHISVQISVKIIFLFFCKLNFTIYFIKHNFLVMNLHEYWQNIMFAREQMNILLLFWLNLVICPQNGIMLLIWDRVDGHLFRICPIFFTKIIRFRIPISHHWKFKAQHEFMRWYFISWFVEVEKKCVLGVF